MGLDKYDNLTVVFGVLVIATSLYGIFQSNSEILAASVPPPGFKVAFIGDQGLGSTDSIPVLQLIKNEGANMVLHQGDYDYSDNPAAWDQQITGVLGADFPYFASIGNHDVAAWPGYQQKLYDRLAKIPGAVCTGDLGVKAGCTYQGLFFILSGVGTMGTDHDVYIKDQLAQDNSIWSICSWHKNMQAMQVGSKSDSTGWAVYEECKNGGAIIATGHEHSYERTKTMTSIQNQVIDPEWPGVNNVRVAPGASFVFVSGLGGASIRNQDLCLPTTFPYGCNGLWASIYTSDQGANYGALFCSFNVGGQANKAQCYFKDISGNIPDQFEITSFMGTPVSSSPTAKAGPDQTISDNDGSGAETVTLDGSGSSDPDGTIASYEWKEGATALGTTSIITSNFLVGVHTVTLTVTDNEGKTGTDAVVVTVQPNQAPIANAGPDQTVSDPDDDGETVTLDGSGSSDPDGTISSYEWKEGATVLGATSTVTAIFSVGTHTVELTVTDNGGATTTDTVVITVVDNQPPTANAGADQTVSDADGTGSETVTLSGSGSDPDGTIASYEWKEGATALGTTATITPSLSVGIHTITLTVTDNGGKTGTDTVTITVNASPPPTTVLYSDNFDDNNISEYQQLGSSWTTVLETGKGYVLRHTANGNTIIFPPNESFNNNYQVKAQIWNGDNDAAGLAFRVNTSDGDNFYSCSASADSAFNAGIWQHVNDLDGTPTSQLATKPWSYVTGRWYTITVTINQDSSTINCIWEGEAGVELNLTVSDPNPLASGSVGIWLSHQNNFKGDLLEVRTLGPTEANQAPTANAGPDKTVSDSDGTGAEPVTLIGSGTDPDGTIASYEWKEGATVLGTAATITSNFLVGTHTVTLTVKDDGGATGTDTVLVTVQANQAPIVEFSDSFEDATLNKWVQDSQKDWFVSTQRARDGSRTAEVDGSANGATITVNSPVNLQGKISAKLTYSWFIESNWDSGEYICLDIFSNGIWNNGVPGTSRCLDGDVVAEEGQWHDVSLDLSSYLTNDFKIKFRAKVSGSSEDGNVDKVIVTSIS